jgi:uncharacterized surface protein with fasciclin (FAS1) repeats
MSLKTNVSSKILLLGFCILTIFNACKKDDNGGNGGGTQPAIASFTPTSGTTGTSVTITGTNFTGTTSVKFGNVAATSFNVVNATTITAVVGAGATGDVSVTTAAGTATKGTFTYNAPPANAPTITSFTPTSGTTGTSVTITGTNLTGATAVKFGNVNATSFTVVSATSITAVVGSGATGKVSVTTPGGTATSTGDFTFNTPPGANTIAGKINSDAELTQLKAGVGVANLSTALSGTGPFTVFAPVDAAFAAYAINMSSLDATTANNIIRYHTLSGKYTFNDFPTGENTKYSTINTPVDSVFVTKFTTAQGTFVYVNGMPINNNQKDIAADNGTIHKLNSPGILFPPTANVYNRISAAGFDSIQKLVKRAELADPNIANILTSNVVTLVAPSNAAFQAFFSAGAIKEINQLTPTQALNILKDHLLIGRKFIINIALSNAGGGTLAYGGSSVKVGSTDGVSYNALYYVTTAAVTLGTVDIMCFNGVIHRSNQILTK